MACSGFVEADHVHVTCAGFAGDCFSVFASTGDGENANGSASATGTAVPRHPDRLEPGTSRTTHRRPQIHPAVPMRFAPTAPPCRPSSPRPLEPCAECPQICVVERIERLEEEKKGIADDIRDVYAEAKAVGYDAKIMRQIVRLRKMKPDDRNEMEMLLDTYKAALGLG